MEGFSLSAATLEKLKTKAIRLTLLWHCELLCWIATLSGPHDSAQLRLRNGISIDEELSTMADRL